MNELLPDAPQCLKRSERRIAPGVYVCAEDHMHIVVPELCRAAGYAVTPENIATLTKAALETLPKSYPDTKIQVVE